MGAAFLRSFTVLNITLVADMLYPRTINLAQDWFDSIPWIAWQISKRGVLAVFTEWESAV